MPRPLHRARLGESIGSPFHRRLSIGLRASSRGTMVFALFGVTANSTVTGLVRGTSALLADYRAQPGTSCAAPKNVMVDKPKSSKNVAASAEPWMRKMMYGMRFRSKRNLRKARGRGR